MRSPIRITTVIGLSISLFAGLIGGADAAPHAAPLTEEPSSLEWAGSWPYGPSQSLAVDENRQIVFLGSGGAVLILDIQDPANPTLISDQLITHGQVLDIAYDGATQRIYIAAGESGFEIWDVSTPGSPSRLSATEITYFNVETPVEGVVVVGDYAYLATNWGYLHWVNVSDPYNPVDEGFNGQGGNPTIGISTTGTHIYTCGASFQEWTIQPDGSASAGNYHDFTYCTMPYGNGDFGYANYSGDLYIMDGTLPYFPIVAVHSAPGAVSDIQIAGTTGYLLFQDFSQPGMQILNLSNPANPVVLGTFYLPATGDRTALADTMAFIADGSAGLQIADVTNPMTPTAVGSYDAVGSTVDTRIQENVAYLASQDRLQILDIGDPANPILLSEIPSNGSLHDVALQDTLAYVADWTGGFRIFDVSDPANPIEIGADGSYDFWFVDVQGDWAYLIETIVNQNYPLHIYDISDPANPVEASSLTLPKFLDEIEVRGNFLYIADYQNGVRVVDISDPYNPFTETIFPLPDVADIALQGNYLYVASTDWDGGLVVLDITNPANPALVTIYNPSGWFHPFRVEAVGNYVYTSDIYSELQLFDVSDPANPIELETFQTAGDLSKMTANGDELYISDGRAGMIVLHNALVSPYTAAFSGDSEKVGLPGETATHSFELTNLGLTDTYSLTISDEVWTSTITSPSPITIASGDTAAITVEVQIPAESPEPNDTFTLTAWSQGNMSSSVEAVGTTVALVEPTTWRVFLPVIIH